MTTETFIESTLQGAIEGYQRIGILPSVTIAQAILESSWGNSGLTKVSNNLFGIKGTSDWGYVLYPTKEYLNGKWVSVDAKFCKYPTFTESISDHTEFLTASRYKPVLNAKTYQDQCSQLQKCGYATDPDYPAKLISLIEKYSLYMYDTVEELPTYIFFPGETRIVDFNGYKVKIIVSKNTPSE